MQKKRRGGGGPVGVGIGGSGGGGVMVILQKKKSGGIEALHEIWPDWLSGFGELSFKMMDDRRQIMDKNTLSTLCEPMAKKSLKSSSTIF